jgi:general secretion pathway protein E
MSLPHPIGDALIAAGKLEPAELERALRVQRDTGERLGTLLVQLGFVAERDLAAALAQEAGLPLAGPERYREPPTCLDRLSLEFLKRNQVLPLTESDEGVEVAMVDPDDGYLVQALELALGKPVRPVVGVSTDIIAAVQTLQGQEADSLAGISGGMADAEASLDDIEHLKDMASEAPVIRMVNHLIARALDMRASDIHIEPFEGSLTVRFRVDGVLREMEAPPVASAAAVTSRIKVMANLNIAERRLPQDGRIKVRVEGREVDMRISTIPTMHGESVVMRLLDQRGVPLDFAQLGFQGRVLKQFEALLARPQGIILVTGPTGSGKTTTLYAALERLNTPEKKILTVEDPVEYQIDGINQIQVRPNIDLTFANALRSILRQDPDIIMIGEMRDTETAAIAVQSALTGHKVLSTLHTNDAPSSVTRLLDMHVQDYLLTSTLDGILAQRLVRRLCPHCRQPYTPDPEWVRETGLDRIAGGSAVTLYKPLGCDHCEHTGYWGRTTILELLVMSEPLRRVILEQRDADAIRRVALAEGMVPMRDDGLRKALDGLTTVEEVERVTQASDHAVV